MDDIPMERMPWWQGMITRFFPKLFFRWHARRKGIDATLCDKAHEVFTRVDRVDLFPLQSGSRGFQIILDRHTALYFYQGDDHFIYDGFEMGEYEKWA